MNSKTLSAPRSKDDPSVEAVKAPAKEPSMIAPVTGGGGEPEAGEWELRTPRGWFFNIALPLLILLGGFAIFKMLGAVEPKARPADDQTLAGRLRRFPAVEVTPVRTLQEIGKPLELVVDGVVVPHQEVQIAAEVSGRVIEKSPLCQAGNFVQKGQLLVKIDPTDYQQEVERLTQAREEDYQAIKEVDQEIANSKLTLEIAKKDVELAQREVDRLRALPAGFVSEGEIDQAEKAQLVSNQNRVTIENQLNLLATRRGRLEASERLAATQLESSKINLQRCEIVSPADGMIVKEEAELNSFLVRGAPIVMLEDIRKADVSINLRMDQLFWVLDQGENRLIPHENEAAAIEAIRREGYSLPKTPAVVEYEIAGLAGRTYRWNGNLVRYDGIGLDSRSRTVPVKVEVDDPDHVITDDGSTKLAAGPSALVRGMFVRVRLQITPKSPLVVIPATAMRPGNRVWQFIDDPKVLDVVANDPKEGVKADATQANTASVAAAGVDPAAVADVVESEVPLNPDEWAAGRVVVLENLAPIDVLRLGEDVEEGGEGSGIVGRDGRRYWVCAVNDNALPGGSWLVSTPLGDFGSGPGSREMSVRVLKSGMKP
jgi:multidrug efflux pump subunit AcrA (membrane-fusion protein)